MNRQFGREEKQHRPAAPQRNQFILGLSGDMAGNRSSPSAKTEAARWCGWRSTLARCDWVACSVVVERSKSKRGLAALVDFVCCVRVTRVEDNQSESNT